jgi:hypothetical protein
MFPHFRLCPPLFDYPCLAIYIDLGNPRELFCMLNTQMRRDIDEVKSTKPSRVEHAGISFESDVTWNT